MIKNTTDLHTDINNLINNISNTIDDKVVEIAYNTSSINENKNYDMDCIVKWNNKTKNDIFDEIKLMLGSLSSQQLLNAKNRLNDYLNYFNYLEGTHTTLLYIISIPNTIHSFITDFVNLNNKKQYKINDNVLFVE